ncbi:protein phosphatase 1 regulatory subunit 1B-like [Oncorhynchus masou masou]|uniref:protein phosphatase 1 regulatory subunit 1B-like n=1 Tax=Oncorhynchus masou masou TaxID=90313 RepID=UPI0031845B57
MDLTCRSSLLSKAGSYSSEPLIRRRRPTPATLVASSDQSSPEIDEDRLPNQLYKAALLNSPRQRRKGARCTPTMKELQFMVEHHLYKQQHGGDDECSSESCLSDRPSPDTLPTGEEEELELPEDEEAWGTGDNVTAEAFEKLRCQMEAEFSRDSLSDAAGGHEGSFSKEEVGCSTVPMAATSSSQQKQPTQAASPEEKKTKKPTQE